MNKELAQKRRCTDPMFISDQDRNNIDIIGVSSRKLDAYFSSKIASARYLGENNWLNSRGQAKLMGRWTGPSLCLAVLRVACHDAPKTRYFVNAVNEVIQKDGLTFTLMTNGDVKYFGLQGKHFFWLGGVDRK